jgi:sugar/nucleoside kinase (ribokinase family)
MKVMAVRPDGLRVPQPIPNVAEWCGCFDVLQMNEDELATIAPDPLSLAATAIAAGVSCLLVTLGKRGAVYVAAPGFETIADLPPREGLATGPRGATGGPGAVRTALVPAEYVAGAGDPTGCGDVWGATHFSRMVAGDRLSDAMRAAAVAAARNVGHRGATGLAAHLRGELSLK